MPAVPVTWQDKDPQAHSQSAEEILGRGLGPRLTAGNVPMGPTSGWRLQAPGEAEPAEGGLAGKSDAHRARAKARARRSCEDLPTGVVSPEPATPRPAGRWALRGRRPALPGGFLCTQDSGLAQGHGKA